MTAPAGYPDNNPKIIYNAKTLWLPRKFVKADLTRTTNPALTEGDTYVQVVSNPVRYKWKGTTDKFLDVSAIWVEGEAAKLFTVAWDTFYTTWAGLGKVFEFYRSATDSTAHVSYFQYAVWSGKDDGLALTVGNPRYEVEIAFSTEGAAR